MEHAALGYRLEGRPTQHAVHALTQEVAVAKLGTHVECQLLQIAVVRVRHAGESHAKPDRERHEGREEERNDKLGETYYAMRDKSQVERRKDERWIYNTLCVKYTVCVH